MIGRVLLTLSALAALGCGGPARTVSAPRAGCTSGALPAGHWIGEWKTYALSNPANLRSGTIDVVIGSDGKLTGTTTESDNPDLGTVKGTVKATGELRATAAVVRGGFEQKYQLAGTLACEGEALAGIGETSWGSADKAALKLRVLRAD
jgi:hypothetical protein